MTELLTCSLQVNIFPLEKLLKMCTLWNRISEGTHFERIEVIPPPLIMGWEKREEGGKKMIQTT